VELEFAYLGILMFQHNNKYKHTQNKGERFGKSFDGRKFKI